jgi:molybdopterin synthase catalytic subunit
MTTTVRIQAEPFDVAAEIASLTAGRADAGAVVSFVGLCRDEGGRLRALELEHYPGMAHAEMTRVAEEAGRRWRLLGQTAIHRFGLIEPGAPIVLVATAAPHRGAAFEAAAFMMDFLKTRAPFWKREHLVGGGAGPWVDARIEDDDAASRWGMTG